MPPAAVVTNLTSHGTPLSPGPGSSNVLIGKKPAFRALSDFHTCPLVTVLVPHVGGMVIMGSTTVLINKLPAARLGDTIVEVGPPNTITEGELTVNIGG